MLYQTYFCWHIRLFLRFASYTCLWTGWNPPSITGKALGIGFVRTVEPTQRYDVVWWVQCLRRTCVMGRKLLETVECMEWHTVHSFDDVPHGVWQTDALTSRIRFFPLLFKDLVKNTWNVKLYAICQVTLTLLLTTYKKIYAQIYDSHI